MRVFPFRGLRPTADFAASVPCPPYDVLGDSQAREIARSEPSSFVRVIRAEVDSDGAIDPHASEVYARARRNLRTMISDGRMSHDPTASFYVYRLAVDDHVQDGIVGASAIDDYLEGSVRRHELTRPDKESDRVRHIEETGAQCGPVLLTYRDEDAIDRMVRAVTQTPSDVEFEAADGVRHGLWRVADPGTVREWSEALGGIAHSYIADGHHRAAAAARVARVLRERHGAGPWDGFLSVLFPASQLRVLEYDRLVRDTAGLDDHQLCERIRHAGFDIVDDRAAARPARAGTFGMITGSGRWRLLVRRGTAMDEGPAEALDVSVLTRRILEPILGIRDLRTDPRIEFFGGAEAASELERRARAGTGAIGFALHPTRIDDVLRVADAGAVMPPKSTWFEPKARSGMVVLDFETPSATDST